MNRLNRFYDWLHDNEERVSWMFVRAACFLFGGFLVLCFSGCASTPTVVMIPHIERAMPTQAMEACPELDLLADASTEEKSRWIAKAAPQYGSCADKQKALADWIKAGRKPK